jgi:hypothetical protein
MPAKVGKPGEIGVRRTQGETMFDGEGCQVRVPHKIGSGIAAP